MVETIHNLALPNEANEKTDRSVYKLDVVAQTDLALDTFDSLGLVDDEQAAWMHIGQHMQGLSDELSARDIKLGVEPFMAVELTEQFGLDALVKAFDAKKRGQHRHNTFVFESLWRQYTPAELNLRTTYTLAFNDTNVTPGILGSARAMLPGGPNDYNEAGLYVTNQNLSNQIWATQGHKLINPADYIMLQAQRREAGQTPLDTLTRTRFIQLDEKNHNDHAYIPAAGWRDSQLELHKSVGVCVYSDEGVRLSVG